MGVLTPKSQTGGKSGIKPRRIGSNNVNNGTKPFQRTIPSNSHYQYRTQKNKNQNRLVC